MSEAVHTARYDQPPVQLWPIRLRYIRRMRQYLSFTTGRCSPMALVDDLEGNRFEAIIVRPAKHAEDTWKVRAINRSGFPEYEVTTSQILDIECGRVVAGYEC